MTSGANNFKDFPGPGILKKKIQDFPGGMGTLRNFSD